MYMDIEERIRKLSKLANRGIGGEKENAELLLKKIMKKYNITEEQVKSKELNFYKFSVANEWEKKLLFQTIYKILGNDGFNDIKLYKKSKVSYYFELTAEEKIEIEYVYSIYKQDFSKEMEVFYTAFLYKNNIFPKDAPKGESKEVDLKKAFQISNYMNGIERSNIHKALNE